MARGGQRASQAVVRLADVARALSGRDTQLFPSLATLLGSGLQHGIECVFSFFMRGGGNWRGKSRLSLSLFVPCRVLSCTELLLLC